MKTGINVSRFLELRDSAEWARLLAGYSMIRVMNWLPVTIPLHVKDEAWMPSSADEIIRNDATGPGNWFGRNGYPSLKWTMDLCAMLGADVWLCLPHYLHDSEAEKLIRYAAARCKLLIVEWSNEVWNSGFLAFHDLGADAVNALRTQARRVISIHKRTRDLSHVRFVFAAWAGNDWTAQQVFESTPIADYVDALAIAPYFGMQADNWQAAAADVYAAADRVRKFERFGLPIWCYEAGQHMQGPHSAEMNRSIWMGQLYRLYRQQMEAAGVGLLNWYSAATAYSGRAFGLYEAVDGRAVATHKSAAARGGS